MRPRKRRRSTDFGAAAACHQREQSREQQAGDRVSHCSVELSPVASSLCARNDTAGAVRSGRHPLTLVAGITWLERDFALCSYDTCHMNLNPKLPPVLLT